MTDPMPAGFGAARIVDVGGTIFPGLIELHDHLLFAAVPLWAPAWPRDIFSSRYDWPEVTNCRKAVMEPAAVSGLLAGSELLAYGQWKKVVGGTTSVQGSIRGPGADRGWFLRNVEAESFDGVTGPVRSVVARLTADDRRSGRAARSEDGAFLCHLAEGTDPRLRSEFAELADDGVIGAGFVGIHSIALEVEDLRHLGRHGGALVWSPFSNLWLYDRTADVSGALAAGVRVTIGSDWSPSGTKNQLGELKVAAGLLDPMGTELTAEQLCAMVTRDAAAAIRWDSQVGSIAAGLQADLCVVRTTHGDHRDLLDAWERDVMLVTVQGQPVYGDRTTLDRCGVGQQAVPVPGWLPGKEVVVGARGAPNPVTVLETLGRLADDPVEFLRSAAPLEDADDWITSATTLPEFSEPGDLSSSSIAGLTIPGPDSWGHDQKFWATTAARSPRLAQALASHAHQQQTHPRRSTEST